MNRNKIEAYISKDESEKGLEILMKDQIQNYPSYKQEEIILLSSRFSSLKKKYHLGLVTSEQYQTERNKLNLDLLHLIKNTEPLQADDLNELDQEKRFQPESFEGKRIGNYEIQKFIGAGGFGNVYLARQTYLQNTYAVKISHEIKVSKKYLDNIVSFGIRSLKFLKHRNVITIHDVGEIEVGGHPRIYIVMDYINGGTLDELPKNNLTTIEIDKKIDIFKKVCLAIQAAHNLVHNNKFGYEIQGLYHGDIKPQNILIDEKNEPIVIDFMFVDMNSLYETIVNAPQKMDRSTAVFGTPGYMPFEQEQNGIVNRQTDIYALGILLFEIFSSIRFSELEEKSQQSIANHLKIQNPKIPKYVSQIVYKSTLDNPEERIKNVEELLNSLSPDPSAWWKRILKK